MPTALYILDDRSYDLIYGPEERRDIAGLVEVLGPQLTAETATTNPDLLRDAEFVFSGWGAPCFDAELLAMMPRLRVVFYGAGSIRAMVSDAFWERQITVCSAWAANAVPVAEFTLAQILLSLKRFWPYSAAVKRDGAYPERFPVPGAYGSTVGLISLGMVGRRVCQLLQPFDINIVAHDPFVDPAVADELGITLCSLEDVFRNADVVSLHTPLLDSTRGMITGAHIASMKPGAAFINTARGAVVREEEMIAVLQQRDDLYVLLDVTYPEPPAAGSPLYTLPNVVLTPHIAGSMDGECRRMGRYMVDELRRYLVGEPLQWQITRERHALLG